MEKTALTEKAITLVAYTSDAWDSAVPVIRLVAPARRAGVMLIRGNEGEHVAPERVSLADAVVIQRDFPRHIEACAAVLAQARVQGKPVIYDLDDLLFEIPEEHMDHASHHYTAALIPMLRMILEADAVTVSTSPLAAYLRPLKRNVWIQPNYLDETMWPAQPDFAQKSSPLMTIGYMGGRTHYSDAELVAPALREIALRYGDRIRLMFWGLEPPAILSELPQTQWLPIGLTNYHDFVDFFVTQHCDIFIAPLRDTLFNQCKSAIKFLEYSVSGSPGVYSRVTPYESVVTHKQDGFLCNGTEEWVDALTCLVEDADLRQRMGQHARATLLDRWTLGTQAQVWRSVYDEILDHSIGGPVDTSSVALLNLVTRFQSEVDLIREAQFNSQINCLETQIRELKQEHQYEMDSLKQTLSWKLLERLWKLEKWVKPL